MISTVLGVEESGQYFQIPDPSFRPELGWPGPSAPPSGGCGDMCAPAGPQCCQLCQLVSLGRGWHYCFQLGIADQHQGRAGGSGTELKAHKHSGCVLSPLKTLGQRPVHWSFLSCCLPEPTVWDLSLWAHLQGFPQDKVTSWPEDHMGWNLWKNLSGLHNTNTASASGQIHLLGLFHRQSLLENPNSDLWIQAA